MMYSGRICWLLYLAVTLIGLSCIYVVEGSCEVDYCKNNATCVHDNTINTTTCKCSPQYTGEFCETLNNPCDPDPCYHGGTCTVEADGFKCVCTQHFLGDRCEAVRRYCLYDNPCDNNAVCEDIHDGGYTCYCTPGYYGNHCEKEIDECGPSPCDETATCQDEINGYTCLCPPGRTGKHCETIDSSGCTSQPCMNAGSCINTGVDTQYSCTCVEGYTGVHCQTNIDDCLQVQCGQYQICTDLANGYRCDCIAGRTGDTCEEVVDTCVSQPCQNSGTCVHDTDRYICNCPQGYAGIHCETQIDPCYPNPCHHQAICITNHTLATGYMCNCTEHFLGDRCEGKITSCQSSPCHSGGTCTENIDTPGYTCKCASGYTGTQCETRLDGCLLAGCNNGGTCKQYDTGHNCTCTPGWTGEDCSIDKDECNISPCYNGAACINLPGSFICLCGDNWTGNHCEQDIADCNTTFCKNNGTCIEKEGELSKCQCREGTTGIYCETVLDGCDSNPCINGAQCISGNRNYTCQCLPGFQGRFCEENINDCEPDPCMNNGTCEDGDNYYVCTCIQGYQGVNCSEEVEECKSAPCLHGGVCTEPIINQYHCDCLPGLHGNNCEIVTVATFDGSTSIRIEPLPGLTRIHQEVLPEGEIQNEDFNVTKATITFWFSTSIFQGTILSIGDVSENVHLLVQLDNRKVLVSIDMYGETVSGSIELSSQAAVMSHNVHLTVTTSHTNITIDNCPEGGNCDLTLQYIKVGEAINLRGHLVIGGVDIVTPYLRSKVLSLSKFTGCIGNVSVNDEILNLSVTGQSTLLPGCRSHDLCHDNRCQNGGSCHDMWTTSYCKCTPGYTGSACEFQQAAQFEMGSFLHFSKGLSKITSLSLWFTSKAASGVILYTLDSDMLCLYIDRGSLVVYLVGNDDDFITTIGDVQNGDWFKISIQFISGIYKLTLSDEAKVIESKSGQVGQSINVHAPLFMGQIHKHPTLDMWRNKISLNQYTSFVGCIRNLTINEKVIDLQTAFHSVFGNDPVAAKPGCSRDSGCTVLSCQHGGTCIPAWTNQTCQCTSSFTGEVCDEAVATTLNGKTSYIDMKLNTSIIPFGDTGYFEFRTRDETATLIYIQFYNSELMNASFEFGVYETSLDVILTSVDISQMRLNTSVSDGDWHTVILVRNTDLITVFVDNVSQSMPVNFDPFIFDPVVRVFIGGKPFHHDDPGFMIGLTKGCFRNISFNNNNIDIHDEFQKEPGVTIFKKNVLTGCIGDNVCKEGACPQNSDCDDIWNDRICTCHEGWHGNTCNVSVDDCVDNLCKYGECVDMHRNYTCLCNDGYRGKLCDVLYNPCDSMPCFENGTVNCTLKFPSQFECLCEQGWSGVTCAQNINECDSYPCLNNGICTDLLNDFECSCPTNSFGKRCEHIYICSSSPCFNGGTCVPYENNTDYMCECRTGYTGKKCQTYDFCHQNLCQNNGSCVSNSSGYMCSCLPENYGAYCQFNDYCASVPCQNNAICHNDVTTFRCTCNKLYSGETCDVPINRCDQNVCKNGGSCFFNVSDLNLNYTCECLEGFTGEHCETDINECQSNPCQNGADCIESNQQPWKFFAGFHCECIQGYKGEYCETNINDCESMPCSNNGTCIDLVNKFECNCLEGFMGNLCELDKRGCASAPCNNGGSCEQNGDSYTCVCVSGFTGTYCNVDIDNCVNNACVNGAVCVDGIDSYMCQCLPGYGGEHCEQVHDACFSQPCKNNGKCIFRGLCNCTDVIESCGWHNETCQMDLCSNTSDCSTYNTAYICDCVNTGYQGEACDTDVDECLLDGACEHGGVCTNTVGNYTCDCKQTGYVGWRCEEDINECSGPNPCYNAGECKNLFGSFKCLCGAGWTGETCGELIDSCQGNMCKNNGVCVNTRSGYICNCAGTGFQGDNCDINVNDCVGNPCINNGRCIDGINSFTCDCVGTGYHGNLCEIETDDCVDSPCKNNGSCTDLGLSYKCECMPGYTGVVCSKDIDECITDQHRCTADSTCENSVGSYSCLCSDTFTGQFCEVSLLKSSDNSTDTTGVIAASVIIIVVIIIILLLYAAWYIRRSRHMKGRYKPSQIEAANRPSVAVIPLDKIIDPTTGERLI